jgi:hypothetical protein
VVTAEVERHIAAGMDIIAKATAEGKLGEADLRALQRVVAQIPVPQRYEVLSHLAAAVNAKEVVVNASGHALFTPSALARVLSDDTR